MQERVKDVANLDALLLEEFIEAELGKDEIEVEKEGWSFHIVRIVTIFLLILIIILGLMKIF